MIELRDIYKTYFLGEKKEREEVPVLRGVSLKIPDGAFVALM